MSDQTASVPTSGRRLEDHLPPCAVDALKAESAGSGYSIREIVILALANDLLQRGTATRNEVRVKQALELLQVIHGGETPRRREGE